MTAESAWPPRPIFCSYCRNEATHPSYLQFGDGEKLWRPTCSRHFQDLQAEAERASRTLRVHLTVLQALPPGERSDA